MTSRQIPDRHQRVVRALQAGGPATPDSLVRRVEVAVDRPARRFTWRLPALAAATAVAAVGLVLALVPHGPTVTDAAALVDRAPTRAAPGPHPSRPALLDQRFEGVPYPDWSRFHWMAMGARTDTVGDRRAETVYYTHHGHVIAYTVIAGEPLPPPDGATTERAGGLELHRFRDGHRDVVTFVRGGRSCVLSGHVISSDTIVELASWKGGGAIHF